jgi:GNAT superfamily N-acetyltransferase
MKQPWWISPYASALGRDGVLAGRALRPRPSARIPGATIRGLEPGDHDELRAMFERLSPDSKYRRFLSPAASFDVALRNVLDLDYVHRDAIRRQLWTARSSASGNATRSEGPPPMSRSRSRVDDAFQRRGIGSELLESHDRHAPPVMERRTCTRASGREPTNARDAHQDRAETRTKSSIGCRRLRSFPYKRAPEAGNASVTGARCMFSEHFARSRRAKCAENGWNRPHNDAIGR